MAMIRILLLGVVPTLVFGTILGSSVLKSFPVTLAAWFVCFLATVFILYFFRDPNPETPTDPGLVVAPGHGKVDVIDETMELEVMNGACKRVSIFLSVFDIHVQRSPFAGKTCLVKHTPGQFLSALKTESATHNENVLIGLKTTGPNPQKIGVRLIAGLIARRIIPWVQLNDDVQRGERMSLIQFGSRVDLYLPLDAQVLVILGQRVIVGKTVIARLSP